METCRQCASSIFRVGCLALVCLIRQIIAGIILPYGLSGYWYFTFGRLKTYPSLQTVSYILESTLSLPILLFTSSIMSCYAVSHVDFFITVRFFGGVISSRDRPPASLLNNLTCVTPINFIFVVMSDRAICYRGPMAFVFIMTSKQTGSGSSGVQCRAFVRLALICWCNAEEPVKTSVVDCVKILLCVATASHWLTCALYVAPDCRSLLHFIWYWRSHVAFAKSWEMI